jgi:PAS domain S-box-containing protein
LKEAAAAGSVFPCSWFFAGFSVLTLVVISLLALSLSAEHRDANRNAGADVENFSRMLEENVLSAVQKSDLLLREVQRNVRPDDMRSAGGAAASRGRELHALLKSLRESVPEVAALHVTDAGGKPIYISLDTVPPINIGDRVHFTRQRDDAAAGLVVSPPVVSRTTGKWTLVLTRRLDFADGRFAGIVNSILNLDYFQTFYGSLGLGSHGMAALYDSDWRLVARYPASERHVGQAVSDLGVRPPSGAGIAHGQYYGASPLDGIVRLYGFRRVSGLPLIVVAGIAADDYLAEWRRHVWQTGVGVLVLVLLVAVFGVRQRRAADELRAASSYGRSLIEASLDPLVTIRADGKIMDVNSATETVTGRVRQQLIGSDFADYFTDPDQARQAYRQVFAQGQVTDYPLAIRHESGQITEVLYNASVYRDARGRVAGVFAAARDVTKRKLAEQELRRSNADLEQFAYAISHDMRQPLRMVSSYLQLIEKALRDKLDADTRQYLAFAREGASRMDGMILALLDFSRVGRKTDPMALQETRPMLDEALAFLGPELAAGGGTVSVAGDWPSLVVSRDEMVRLFQNLVGNALKYHDDGQLPVVAVVGDRRQDCWRCEVRDRGIGIDPAQVDRLFKVFSRLQARSRFDGAGVGLALCRKIVEHHGGRIGVASAGESLGSVFWFELPLPGSLAQTGAVPP